jgi:Ubiquitin-binding domain
MGNCCCKHEERQASLNLSNRANLPGSGSIVIGGNQRLVDFSKYIKPTEKPVDILQKRNTFWDTQPFYSGRMEIWQMIRLAAESDSQTAQAIIDSENITCPTGKLTDGCYDSTGNFYVIPDYCLGPLAMTDDEMAKSISLNTTPLMRDPSALDTYLSTAGAESFPIIARISSGQDISINVHPQMTIGKFKAAIGKSQSYSPEVTTKLKVVLFGKVLANEAKIIETKIKEKSIVQVFVI